MAKGNTTFNLLFKSNGQSVLQELSANLADVESAVKAVTESAKGLEKPMSKLYTNAMGAVAINDLIGQAKSAVDGLAQSWQEFDEGMRKVNTMAGLGRDGLKPAHSAGGGTTDWSGTRQQKCRTKYRPQQKTV